MAWAKVIKKGKKQKKKRKKKSSATWQTASKLLGTQLKINSKCPKILAD
jgi:hypothetical protein